MDDYREKKERTENVLGSAQFVEDCPEAKTTDSQQYDETWTYHLMIRLLATISTVFGCGVMPAGQASTRTFTVFGFTLPVMMGLLFRSRCSGPGPGISIDKARAQAFVHRLVMQTVFNVLDNQARDAFLPDAMISAILD
ncbi:hypothetical protein KIN20_030327 [Parelaphostrongylus tenuis]|uniref:Uncharacterized protein n=1 Tax=Parelaphostrongylus tenuis TaxID=148309 RepID=A0AAD5WGA7_PARTN|nr:hypothetical protein KIN20_030327 [Parelaphostrongylus tenuis]